MGCGSSNDKEVLQPKLVPKQNKSEFEDGLQVKNSQIGSLKKQALQQEKSPAESQAELRGDERTLDLSNFKPPQKRPRPKLYPDDDEIEQVPYEKIELSEEVELTPNEELRKAIIASGRLRVQQLREQLGTNDICLIEEFHDPSRDQKVVVKDEAYKIRKQQEYFKLPRLPKKLQLIQKQEQLYLQHLDWNIIHEFVRQKRWDLFEQAFLIVPEWYVYQGMDYISQKGRFPNFKRAVSPFIKFLESAPLDIILGFHANPNNHVNLKQIYQKVINGAFQSIILNKKVDIQSPSLLQVVISIKEMITEQQFQSAVNHISSHNLIPLGAILERIRLSKCQSLSQGLLTLIDLLIKSTDKPSMQLQLVHSTAEQELCEKNCFQLAKFILSIDNSLFQILIDKLNWLEWRSQIGVNSSLLFYSYRLGQFNKTKYILSKYGTEMVVIINESEICLLFNIIDLYEACSVSLRNKNIADRQIHLEIQETSLKIIYQAFNHPQQSYFNFYPQHDYYTCFNRLFMIKEFDVSQINLQAAQQYLNSNYESFMQIAMNGLRAYSGRLFEILAFDQHPQNELIQIGGSRKFVNQQDWKIISLIRNLTANQLSQLQVESNIQTFQLIMLYILTKNQLPQLDNQTVESLFGFCDYLYKPLKIRKFNKKLKWSKRNYQKRAKHLKTLKNRYIRQIIKQIIDQGQIDQMLEYFQENPHKISNQILVDFFQILLRYQWDYKPVQDNIILESINPILKQVRLIFKVNYFTINDFERIYAWQSSGLNLSLLNYVRKSMRLEIYEKLKNPVSPQFKYVALALLENSCIEYQLLANEETYNMKGFSQLILSPEYRTLLFSKLDSRSFITSTIQNKAFSNIWLIKDAFVEHLKRFNQAEKKTDSLEDLNLQWNNYLAKGFFDYLSEYVCKQNSRLSMLSLKKNWYKDDEYQSQYRHHQEVCSFFIKQLWDISQDADKINLTIGHKYKRLSHTLNLDNLLQIHPSILASVQFSYSRIIKNLGEQDAIKFAIHIIPLKLTQEKLSAVERQKIYNLSMLKDVKIVEAIFKYPLSPSIRKQIIINQLTVFHLHDSSTKQFIEANNLDKIFQIYESDLKLFNLTDISKLLKLYLRIGFRKGVNFILLLGSRYKSLYANERLDLNTISLIDLYPEKELTKVFRTSISINFSVGLNEVQLRAFLEDTQKIITEADIEKAILFASVHGLSENLSLLLPKLKNPDIVFYAIDALSERLLIDKGINSPIYDSNQNGEKIRQIMGFQKHQRNQAHPFLFTEVQSTLKQATSLQSNKQPYKIKSIGGEEVIIDPKKKYTVSQLKKLQEQQSKQLLNQEYQILLKTINQNQHREGFFIYLRYRKQNFDETINMIVKKAQAYFDIVDQQIVVDALVKLVIIKADDQQIRDMILKLSSWDHLIQLLIDFCLLPKKIVNQYGQSNQDLLKFILQNPKCKEKIQILVYENIVKYYHDQLSQGQKTYIKSYLLNTIFIWEQNLKNINQSKDVQEGFRRIFRTASYILVNDFKAESNIQFITKHIRGDNLVQVNGPAWRFSSNLLDRQKQANLLSLIKANIFQLKDEYEEQKFRSAMRSKLMEQFCQMPQKRTKFQYLLSNGLDQIIQKNPDIIPKIMSLQDLRFAVVGRNYNCLKLVLSQGKFDMTQLILQEQLLTAITLQFNETAIIDFMMNFLPVLPVENMEQLIQQDNGFNLIANFGFVSQMQAYGTFVMDYLYKKVLGSNRQKMNSILTSLFHQTGDFSKISPKLEDELADVSLLEFCLNIGFYVIVDTVQKFKIDLPKFELEGSLGFLKNKNSTRFLSVQNLPKYVIDTFPLFNNQFQLYKTVLPYLQFSFRGYEKFKKVRGRIINLEDVLTKTKEQKLQVGQFEAQCFLAPLQINDDTIPFNSPIAYLVNQLNTVGIPLDLQEMIDGAKYHLCDAAYIFFNLRMTGMLEKIDEYCLTQQRIKSSPIYKLLWNYPQTLKNLAEYESQRLPREQEPEQVFFIKLVRLASKCGSFDQQHPILEYLVRYYPQNFLLYQLTYEEQETEEMIPEMPDWISVLRDFIIPNLKLFIIWIQSDLNPKEVQKIIRRACRDIEMNDLHFNRNVNLIQLLMLSYNCENLETLGSDIDELFKAKGMKDQTNYSIVLKLLIDYPIQKFRYGLTQTIQAAQSQILVLQDTNYQCEIKGTIYSQFEKLSSMLALTKVMLCTFQIQETLNQVFKLYKELPLISEIPLKIILNLTDSGKISVAFSDSLTLIEYSPIHENEFYYINDDQLTTLKHELVFKAKSLFIAQEQIHKVMPSTGYLENVTSADEILILHQNISDGYNIGIISQESNIADDLTFEQGYDEDDLNAPHNEDGILQEKGSGKDEYFLQLLPDNNFQMVHLITKEKEPEIVLAEFYQFYPQTCEIAHKFLSEKEFKKQYSMMSCINQIIKDLNDRYTMVMVKEASLQQIWPYYIDGFSIKYEKNLDRDRTYQKLRKMFQNFLEAIHRNQGPSARYSTKTRISLLSFFNQVIFKWAQRNLKKDQGGDIMSLVEKFLEWGTFQSIISGILHENLSNQQNILKVIRGVYIDFIETQEAFQIEGSLFDKQISFGKPQYKLQRYYLIIRIGVKHFEKHEPNIDVPTYLDIITNQFSLYEQLLSSELLFQQLFKKVEIDRLMLEFSNQLSQRMKRTAIVSINHRSFQQYFVQQVEAARRIIETKEQHKQLQNVFKLLGDINRYFTIDAASKLMEKIKDGINQQKSIEQYEQLFLNMFQGIITAIKEGIPASRRLMENYRKVDLKRKQNMRSIEVGMKLEAHLDVKKFDYVLGFQVTLQHFFGSSVIGETYIIFWVKESYKGITLIQLASKNRPDTIAYIDLEERSWLEPASLRQRASQTYMKSGQQIDDIANFKYPCYKSDQIQAVILLSKVWPRDNSLNQNVLNVFFVDGNQMLYQITEPDFKEKMCRIASLEDEEQMQVELDQLYGAGKVSAGADLNVCNLVPFLPSNIVFTFDDGAPPQLGNQDSYILQSSLTRGQSQIRQAQQDISLVKIQLVDESKFKVSELQPKKLGVACYFDQNKGYQEMISNFKQELNQFSRLFDSKNLDITVIFDDAMDAHPALYMESFVSQNVSIFDNFIEALLYFIDITRDFPINLKHELQFLNPEVQFQDNIQLLPSMKCKILFQRIKRIEFQVLISESPQALKLVEIIDGCLIARVLMSNDLRQITLPSVNDITHLLYSSCIEESQMQFNNNRLCVFNLKSFGWTLDIRDHKDLELENVIQKIFLIELIQYHAGIFAHHKRLTIGKIIVIQNSLFNEDKSIAHQEFDHPFHISFGEQIDIFIFSDIELSQFSISEFIAFLYRQGQIIDQTQTIQNSIYHLQDFFIKDNIQINISKKSLQLNTYRTIIYSQGSIVENDPEITNTGISIKFDAQIFEESQVFVLVLGTFESFISPAYIIKNQGEGVVFNYISQQQMWNENEQKSVVNETQYVLIPDLKDSKDLKAQITGKLKTASIVGNPESGIKHIYTGQDTLQNLLRIDKKASEVASLKQVQIKTFWISHSLVLLGIQTSKSQKIIIKNLKGAKHTSLEFQFFSDSKLNLSKTTHTSVNGNAHLQKSDQNNDEKEIDFKYQKLFQMVLESTLQVTTSNHHYQSLEHSQHSDELQSNNFITMLGNTQTMNTTRVGELRRDQITFRGDEDDELTIEPQRLKAFRYVFVHSVFPQIQYHLQSENQILEWTPTFKGVYNLFVDGQKVQSQLGFVVLAGELDLQNSVIEFAEQENYEFFSQVMAQAKYRDKYQNIIGDLEYFKYYNGQKLCDLKIEGLGPNQSSVSHQVLSKLGHQSINISFTSEGADSQMEQQSRLLFLINGKVKLEKHIKIKGVGFEKRQKSFVKELQASWKPSSFSVKIRRQNFYEELLSIFENQDLKKTLSIVFHGEDGIDAGGLKREFYDLIGQTLKDQRYKLFAPVVGNADKYFIHPEVFRVKNRANYFLVIGKLIANAIASEYLMGIDIIGPFYKVLYGENIIFSDLALVLDQQSYQNQLSLRSMNAIDLESLELNFQINQGRKMVDLVPNGENILVTQQNLDQYLDCYATYVIKTRYEELHDKFKQGFESVVNLNIFKKWLKPFEISIFTQGQLEIKYENLLNVISYSGVRGNNKVLFDTYLQQSEPQILKNLLKFTTGTDRFIYKGSSSIPFDTTGFTVSVQFISGMDTKRLPISHTCFRSIEVPNYKTFDEMKRKLDVAFTVGIEGFGFA